MDDISNPITAMLAFLRNWFISMQYITVFGGYYKFETPRNIKNPRPPTESIELRVFVRPSVQI